MDDPGRGFWEQVPTWPIWGFAAVALGTLWRIITMRVHQQPDHQHHESIASAAANGDVIGLVRQLLETQSRTERKFDDFQTRMDARFDGFERRIDQLEHPSQTQL